MESEPAVHEPRQHADLGMTEQLTRELGCAIGRAKPAKIATLGATGAVGRSAGCRGEMVAGLAIVTAHIEQRRLAALAQRHDIEARGNRENDMSGEHALAGPVRCFMCGIATL